MKLLGIDYGDAKIGLAVGDTETGLASPWKIIKNRNKNQVITDLKQLCETEGVTKVVLGLPVNQQAKVSNQARMIQNFQADLSQMLPVSVVTYDESFTTQEAQKLSTKKDEDDIAAMIMLQSYIDSQRL